MGDLALSREVPGRRKTTRTSTAVSSSQKEMKAVATTPRTSGSWKATTLLTALHTLLPSFRTIPKITTSLAHSLTTLIQIPTTTTTIMRFIPALLKFYPNYALMEILIRLNKIILISST